MDKADWALIISIGSFLAASASAFYTRRMSLLQAKSMARKGPILSVDDCRPMSVWRPKSDGDSGGNRDYPGYYSVGISITNQQPNVGVRLLSLDTRGKTKIASHEDLVPGGKKAGWTEPEEFPDELPKDASTSRHVLGYNLRTFGTPRHASGQAGDTTYFTVYATNRVTPKDFVLRWEWLDGAKV